MNIFNPLTRSPTSPNFPHSSNFVSSFFPFKPVSSGLCGFRSLGRVAFLWSRAAYQGPQPPTVPQLGVGRHGHLPPPGASRAFCLARSCGCGVPLLICPLAPGRHYFFVVIRHLLPLPSFHLPSHSDPWALGGRDGIQTHRLV